MKNTSFALLLLAALLLSLATSCKKDEFQEGKPLNSFDIGADNYETDYGYLLFDDGPPYNDGFALAFTDGLMQRNSADGNIYVASTAQQAVVLFVDGNPTNFPRLEDIPVTVGSHPLTDDSRLLYDILQYNSTYKHAGITYGTPDESTSSRLEINATGSGTVNIQSISIDYAAMEAQVDISYQFTDGTQTVTGQFQGRVEILEGL